MWLMMIINAMNQGIISHDINPDFPVSAPKGLKYVNVFVLFGVVSIALYGSMYTINPYSSGSLH